MVPKGQVMSTHCVDFYLSSVGGKCQLSRAHWQTRFRAGPTDLIISLIDVA